MKASTVKVLQEALGAVRAEAFRYHEAHWRIAVERGERPLEDPQVRRWSARLAEVEEARADLAAYVRGIAERVIEGTEAGERG